MIRYAKNIVRLLPDKKGIEEKTMTPLFLGQSLLSHLLVTTLVVSALALLAWLLSWLVAYRRKSDDESGENDI